MKGLHSDRSAADRGQAEQNRQRLRVGVLGLAAIVLLIGLASAIFSSVSQERPVAVAGAAQPEVVANMSAPMADPSAAPTNEPLAELGVTPSAAQSPDAEPTPASPAEQPR